MNYEKDIRSIFQKKKYLVSFFFLGWALLNTPVPSFAEPMDAISPKTDLTFSLNPSADEHLLTHQTLKQSLDVSAKNKTEVGQMSSAETCSAIDFRNDFPLKMRHQQETSWCFAHSAADYLQFAFQLPFQISAADIAIGYSETFPSRAIQTLKRLMNRNSGKVPAETGFIRIAINKTMNEGVCPESALPSEHWTKITSNGNSVEVEITEAILDILNLQTQVKSGVIQSVADLPRYYSFKNIDLNSFFNLIKNSSKKDLFTNLRKSACDHERIALPSIFKPLFKVKNKKIFQHIDDSFAHDIPVTIDFFSDILRHPHSPRRSISELHTVLLYGRKWDSNTGCMYMIKDSYGEQCTKYDSSLECENGYVWLPKSKLQKAMTSTLMLINTH